VILAAGCAAVSVSYDYDPDRDFSRLRTYRWLPDSPLEKENQLVARRVMRAVAGELEAKGVQESDGDPDFLILLRGGRESRMDITEWGYDTSPTVRYRGYDWGGYWPGPRWIEVRQYDAGVLVLDFIDAATRELVWRGTAAGAMGRDLTPEESEKLIGEAVAGILANFPPPRK